MSEEIVRRILTNRKKILFESAEIENSILDSPGEPELVAESLVYELEDTIRNLGYVWQVKAIKGNYVLFYAPKKQGEKYAVATGMKEVGRETTWRNEKYFSDPRKAYKYLLAKAGKLTVSDEDDQYMSESEEKSVTKTCECGSTNIIVEDGEEICDDCGRRYYSVKELSEPLIPKKRVEESEKYNKKEVLTSAYRLWSAGKYEKAMLLCKKYGVPEKEFIKLLVYSYRESAEIEGEDLEESSFIKPNPDEEEEYGNIIRAVQKPVSTAGKPNIADAE